MSQLPDVKKHVVAGILEHGPKQFLALGAEQSKCFSEIRPACPEAHRVALSRHVAALLSFLPLACQTLATTGRAYSHRSPLARLKCLSEKRPVGRTDAWCRAPLRDLSKPGL